MFNVAAIANELREGSAFFRDARREKENPHAPTEPAGPVADQGLRGQVPKGTSTLVPLSPSTQGDKYPDRHQKYGFHLSPQHIIKLDGVVISRRRNGLKSDRSSIVRELIDLLEE